jgi:hypothetical protein
MYWLSQFRISLVRQNNFLNNFGQILQINILTNMLWFVLFHTIIIFEIIMDFWITNYLAFIKNKHHIFLLQDIDQTSQVLCIYFFSSKNIMIVLNKIKRFFKSIIISKIMILQNNSSHIIFSRIFIWNIWQKLFEKPMKF